MHHTVQKAHIENHINHMAGCCKHVQLSAMALAICDQHTPVIIDSVVVATSGRLALTHCLLCWRWYRPGAGRLEPGAPPQQPHQRAQEAAG